jgi:hypothetical protein
MIVTYLPLLKNTKIAGITLFPFIFIRDKKDLTNKRLINHERIHIRQQAELLILPFYIIYLINYIRLRFIYNHNDAYRNIIFEREAYVNERNLDYLNTRKWFAFIRYF